MKKIIVFGCGQAGSMASKWLSDGYALLGFTDNAPSMWNTLFNGEPVFSPNEAVEQKPDEILIAVVNSEACAAIEKQLREMGFSGEVHSIQPVRQKYDFRLATLRLLADNLNRVPGAVAELGVFQGAFAAEINKLFPTKVLYLFDTFDGFAERDVKYEKDHYASRARNGDFSDTSVDVVLKRLPYPEQAIICKGWFPETLPQNLLPLCYVSLDADLYQPTYEGLLTFYPKLSPGGVILIHDCTSRQFPGVGDAVKRFCAEQNLFVTPLCDLHGSGILRKGLSRA